MTSKRETYIALQQVLNANETAKIIIGSNYSCSLVFILIWFVYLWFCMCFYLSVCITAFSAMV